MWAVLSHTGSSLRVNRRLQIHISVSEWASKHLSALSAWALRHLQCAWRSVTSRSNQLTLATEILTHIFVNCSLKECPPITQLFSYCCLLTIWPRLVACQREHLKVNVFLLYRSLWQLKSLNESHVCFPAEFPDCAGLCDVSAKPAVCVCWSAEWGSLWL